MTKFTGDQFCGGVCREINDHPVKLGTIDNASAVQSLFKVYVFKVPAIYHHPGFAEKSPRFGPQQAAADLHIKPNRVTLNALEAL